MARKLVYSSAPSLDFGWRGPFVDANDKVYTLVVNATKVYVLKAGADPLVNTWTGPDSGSSPTGTSFKFASAIQDGTKIHVVAWDNSGGNYEYSVFGTSDDASADQWDATIVDEQIEAPTNAPTSGECFISVRSDGDVIVLYNGDTDKVMGTDYDRVDYARRESGSWTVGINVAGDGLEADRYATGIGRGASDKVWFQFRQASGGYLRDLSSTNSLGSELQVSGTGGSWAFLLPYYDDGGVEVMTTARLHTTSDVRSRQTRDGTLQTELALSGTDFNLLPEPAIAVDGTDAYVAYRDDTASDVTYQKSADGAAWGNITTVSTATTPVAISANVIDHGGGKVLAVVYLDTDVYYDEISIGPFSDPPRNRPNEKHIHLLRR